MMGKTFIYGAGGLGIEILDLCGRTQAFHNTDLMFVDDFKFGGMLYGIPIISFESAKADVGLGNMILASGDPTGRQKMFRRAKEAGFNLPVVIDDSARISEFASIGEASIVCAGVTVAARSVISKNVLINVDSIVGHDVRVEEAAVLASKVNTGGNCVIGSESMLGMSVSLRPGISIGKGSIVAVGASVFNDVPDGVTVVGNPARVSRRLNKGENNE